MIERVRLRAFFVWPYNETLIPERILFEMTQAVLLDLKNEQ